jgi:AraC family transcriptional regulator
MLNTIHPKREASCEFQGLRFEQLRYAPGFQLPNHTHEQAYLDLSLSGTMRDCWNGQTSVRGPLTLACMPVGAPHATLFPEEARTLQIMLPAAWLERVQQAAPLGGRVVCYRDSLPVWIAMRLYREFQRRDDLSPLVLEGMLLELLAEMARQSPERAEEKGAPRWLRQTEEYLRANFAEALSIDAVAAAAGVHPSHLMRGFRRQYRCTIGDYVRRLRIEYACHLLSASETPLVQIALAAGFTDQSHFNQTFKGMTGMTPVQFRKAAGRK